MLESILPNSSSILGWSSIGAIETNATSRPLAPYSVKSLAISARRSVQGRQAV